MDANTPRLAGLREEIQRFLHSNCRLIDPAIDDPPALIAAGSDVGSAIAAAQRFQRQCHDARLAGLSAPIEYGGQGLPTTADAIWAEECAQYAIANMTPLAVGLTLAVDTLLAWGSHTLKSRHVAATLSAEQVWCQLFSEPDAGSDLSSICTRATLRDDGSYVVTGSKVWTSYASHADFALLLARTTPGSSGHAGLTMFALDVRAQGVEVRPLREMTGGAHFNEVHLDDVQVDAPCIIGGEGDGWRVAMSTLGSERGRVRQRGRPRWQRVAALRRSHQIDDPVLRDTITQLAVAETVNQWTIERADQDAAQGRVGPSGSMIKLASSRVEQRAAALAANLRGTAATAWDDHTGVDANTVHWFLGSRANSIAGGTDQIQLNIIAERLLDLPREPRARSLVRDTTLRCSQGGPS